MLNILEQEDKYAPAKGELTTFFRPYILHGICAWINTNVSFSTQHYSVIEKKINDFLRSIRKDITEVPTSLIVRKTGISSKSVEHIRVMKQMRRAARIDMVAETNFVEGSLTPYYYTTPEDYYIEVEEKEEILKRIDLLRQGMYNGCTLSNDQVRILREYYGIGRNMPKKMSEIARGKGVTPYFIRKEISIAYKKLRWEIWKGEI